MDKIVLIQYQKSQADIEAFSSGSQHVQILTYLLICESFSQELCSIVQVINCRPLIDRHMFVEIRVPCIIYVCSHPSNRLTKMAL